MAGSTSIDKTPHPLLTPKVFLSKKLNCSVNSENLEESSAGAGERLLVDESLGPNPSSSLKVLLNQKPHC